MNTLIRNGADITQPFHVRRGLTYGTLILYVHNLYIIIPLTQDGATPLHVASQKGHSDIVNTLIRNGADINQPMKVYALYHNPLLLINTVHSSPQDGQMPIDFARSKGHSDIVHILEKDFPTSCDN